MTLHLKNNPNIRDANPTPKNKIIIVMPVAMYRKGTSMSAHFTAACRRLKGIKTSNNFVKKTVISGDFRHEVVYVLMFDCVLPCDKKNVEYDFFCLFGYGLSGERRNSIGTKKSANDPLKNIIRNIKQKDSMMISSSLVCLVMFCL